MTDKNKYRIVGEAMDEALSEKVFPGAVLSVVRPDSIEYVDAFGKLSYDDDALISKKTVFDVASLTKPVCTVTSIMSMFADGLLDLNCRVGDYFSASDLQAPLLDVSLMEILSHSSGMKDYVPFFKDVFERGDVFTGSEAARNFIFESVRKEPLAYGRGEKALYSDLGFILLTEILEKVDGKRIDSICEKRVFEKFGMKNSSFVPWRVKSFSDVFGKRKAAPTEVYPWLKGAARGVVHDENCYAMGGVSGHAGLFSDIFDLSGFVREIILGYEGKSDILQKEICRRFFAKIGRVPASFWAVGWKTPGEEGSSCGEKISANSIGHLGYTGTSIWIDFDLSAGVILLSNRVHPTRDNIKIRDFRRKLHDLLFGILRGK